MTGRITTYFLGRRVYSEIYFTQEKLLPLCVERLLTDAIWLSDYYFFHQCKHTDVSPLWVEVNRQEKWGQILLHSHYFFVFPHRFVFSLSFKTHKLHHSFISSPFTQVSYNERLKSQHCKKKRTTPASDSCLFNFLFGENTASWVTPLVQLFIFDWQDLIVYYCSWPIFRDH